MPYPSNPLRQTHPDHLATLATLLGVRPPAPNHCRVLELGCASGGNLIPMAFALPESTFLGIDLSVEQVAEGQRTVDALGLKNVELRHLSILDVDAGYGPFDYILCHGVYSWVPEHVQDKILDICARHLTADGIGYVSYNTYPGWHMRGMIRDMMSYHVGRFPELPPPERVGRARSFLDFLTRSVPQGDAPYSLLLREQLELLQKHSDSYLFHEHLEEHNAPIYFLQFCERLATRGLRYLGEAEFGAMVSSTSFPAVVQQELEELAPNLLEREQYMDFLRNRTFRQTLVCHAHVRPNYQVRAAQLAGLHVASPARPAAAPPDLASEAPAEFQGFHNRTVTAAAPLVKAALVHLGACWPRALPFDTLRHEARLRVRAAGRDEDSWPEADAQDLARALLTIYAAAGPTLLVLSLQPPCFTDRISERPVASPLARWQAPHTPQVTNLWHEVVPLMPFDRHLLPLLDGTREHAALLDALVERFQQGTLEIAENDATVTEARARAILAEMLERQLPRLARAALLIA